MTGDLQLYSFGGISLSFGGQDLSDQIPLKAKTLLIYVCRQGEPQPREKLASLFWSDSTAERAAHNQRMALMAVREHLGDSVEITRSKIAVNATLDANTLETTYELLRPQLKGERPFSSMDIARLTEALSLYRGDFLAHVDLSDASAFDEWANSERELLHQRFISVGSFLLDVMTTSQTYADGIDLALRLLTADPLHEATHRHLMTLYALSGDRTSALQAFERLQTVLWDELGVEPADESIRLYERIAASAITLLPDTPLVMTGKSLPPTNLPGEITPFLGREHTLEHVQQLMTTTRWLTLVGPGGIGKTRLALKVAEQRRPTFRDGVFWVELAPLLSASGVADAVRVALGLEDSGGHALQELLLDYLRPKQTLLLFDNFEHVLNAAALVDHLLRGAPGLRVLVTSRERLGYYGETVYDVPPLPRTDSMALFLERTQALRIRSHDLDTAILDRLCARLDDMPLAIELAASQAGRRSLSDILNGLDIVQLSSTLRGLPERQRTLFNTIEWSYQLLTSAEQALYRRLSHFVGSWTGEEVAWCGKQDDLENLVEKSLVQRSESAKEGTRYAMLETIRQHARVKLTEAGEETETLRQYLDYYVQFAEAGNLGLRGRDETRWMNRLQAALDNLYAALEYSHETADILTEARLAGALGRFWYFAALPNDARMFLDRVLEQRDTLPPAVLADVLAGSGHSYFTLDRMDLAKACQVEALALYEQVGDLHGQAYMVICLGTHVIDNKQRWELLRQAYALFQQVEDYVLFGGLCNNLSICYVSIGQFEQAEIIIQEAMNRIRGLDLAVEGLLQVGVCSILCASGRLEEALAAIDDYFILTNRIPFFDCVALIERCQLLLLLDRTDQAKTTWQAAIATYEQHDQRYMHQRKLHALRASIAIAECEDQDVRDYFHRAFSELTPDRVDLPDMVDFSMRLAHIVGYIAQKGRLENAVLLQASLLQVLQKNEIPLMYPQRFYLEKAAPLLANTPVPSASAIPENPFTYALECMRFHSLSSG